MSSPTSINIDIVTDKIDKITQALSTEVGEELYAGAQGIAKAAKRNAPGDQNGTGLRDGIGARKISNFQSEAFSNALYSPYLEFGTMEKVSIPAGLEEYAAQFKGDFASGTYSEGGELSFKEAIFAWCQRKGIPEEFWYAIYVSIGIHGIAPRPFFFPAVEQMRPVIIENVQNVINEALQ